MIIARIQTKVLADNQSGDRNCGLYVGIAHLEQQGLKEGDEVIVEVRNLNDKKAALIERLDDIQRWTLKGGNDPEDQGSVSSAVDELIDVVKEALQP